MITTDFLMNEFLPAFSACFWSIGLLVFICAYCAYRFFKGFFDDCEKEKKQREKEKQDNLSSIEQLKSDVNDLKEIILNNSVEVNE